MRAKASATGSIATAMWKALAWISVAAARDGDVAFPEDQVAVLQAGEAYGLAERGLLHVAVAWASHAASGERHLHEAGAVEAEAGLAAP